MTSGTDTLDALKRLADHAEDCWDDCVESRPESRADARESLARWESAIEITRLADRMAPGALRAAIDELELARRTAQEWGDDSTEREAITLLQAAEASAAAAALGRRGGKAGRGASQRRGDSAHYSALGKRGGRPAAHPRAQCVVCDAGGIRTMTSLRSTWTVEVGERVRCAERPVCRSCEAQSRHYPIAR